MIPFFKLLRTFDFHELNLDGFFANLHIENRPFVWYPKYVGNENTNEKKPRFIKINLQFVFIIHQTMFLVNIFVRLEQNITQISRLRRSAALRRTAKNDLPEAKSQSEGRRKNGLYILHETRHNPRRRKKAVRGLRNRGSQPRRKNSTELFGSVFRSGKSGESGGAV